MKKLFIFLLMFSAFAHAGMKGQGGTAKVTVSASAPNFTSNWTVCQWIKPTSTIAAHVIFFDRQSAAGTQIQFDYGAEAAQDIYFWQGTTYVFQSANSVMNDTNWHAICLTRDGSNVWTLYKDGTQIKQVTNAYAQSTSANLIHFFLNAANNFPFLATEAENAFWSVVLTSDQLTAYAKGIPPNQIDALHLQIYLPFYFSLGNGSVTADLSGGQWNGSVSTGTGNVITDNHCACSPPAGAEGH
jgi:Concanavalin A-like lectin/glucanases superfamily